MNALERKKFREGQANYNRLMKLFKQHNNTRNHLYNVTNKFKKANVNVAVAISEARKYPENSIIFKRYALQVKKLDPIRREYGHSMVVSERKLRSIKREIAKLLHGVNGLNNATINRYNISGNIGKLQHMQGSRLARLIENAYLKPGGLYTRRVINSIH